MRRFRLICGALWTGLVVAACGGDSNPTGPGQPNPPPPPPARVILASPAFQANIQEVFNRRGCATGGCHGAANAAGLTLTSGAAYGNLVGVASTQVPAVDRVIPNDADGSYLVVKLEGRQTVGSQMPRGGAALDSIDMRNIKNWINNGAPNN